MGTDTISRTPTNGVSLSRTPSNPKEDSQLQPTTTATTSTMPPQTNHDDYNESHLKPAIPIAKKRKSNISSIEGGQNPPEAPTEIMANNQLQNTKQQNSMIPAVNNQNKIMADIPTAATTIISPPELNPPSSIDVLIPSPAEPSEIEIMEEQIEEQGSEKNNEKINESKKIQKKEEDEVKKNEKNNKNAATTITKNNSIKKEDKEVEEEVVSSPKIELEAIQCIEQQQQKEVVKEEESTAATTTELKSSPAAVVVVSAQKKNNIPEEFMEKNDNEMNNILSSGKKKEEDIYGITSTIESSAIYSPSKNEKI